jgi:DNA-binding response OmpR family regulator
LNPKRILVVDDDDALRRLVERALALEGYAIETASTGMEAIDRVQVAPPDLVLLDLMLPDIDGREVLQHLRDGGHDKMPIIIFTAGLVSPEDRASLGSATVVAKPFDLEDFLSTLRNQLQSN